MKGFWLIPLVGLTACTDVAATDIQASCLPLVEYTQADQTKFADELTAMNGKYPVVEKFLGDYAALRNADRVCLKPH